MTYRRFHFTRFHQWNGGIIGQGGPTNAQFVSLWSQLATKYASQSKVIFGVMNEPHDVPDINVRPPKLFSPDSKALAIRAANESVLLGCGTRYLGMGSDRPARGDRHSCRRCYYPENPLTREQLHVSGDVYFERFGRRSCHRQEP